MRRDDLGPQGAVDLWLAQPEALGAPETDACLDMLSDDELRRWSGYAVADAQLQYLVGKGLQRAALSEYADVAPADWRFEAGGHGKPRIAAPDAGRDLRFNLSHCSGLVALVVAEGIEVGVDVERLDRALDPRELAPLALAAVERDEIDRLGLAESRARFVRLWTLKEAYAKGRGLGVALDFTRTAFDLDGAAPALVADAPGFEPGWRFTELAPTPEHRLAVAARGPALEIRTTWMWSENPA